MSGRSRSRNSDQTSSRRAATGSGEGSWEAIRSRPRGFAPRSTDRAKAPDGATTQLLKYAEEGRLHSSPATARPHYSHDAIIAVASSTITSLGVTLLGTGVHFGSYVLMAAAGALASVGLALLLPALVRLRREEPAESIVDIRRGAVLLPDRIEPGYWVRQENAWVRVDSTNRQGNGDVSALLSSGEIVEMSSPILVAGGPFRPSSRPAATMQANRVGRG